jgi:SAM-dependent methyltransferase
MKFRESGMPTEIIWDTFFDTGSVIKEMEIESSRKTLIDIGCGYGTFLIPASKTVGGSIIGIDIDDAMIDVCRQKILKNNLENVSLICGDISDLKVLKSLEYARGNIDYITMFNILHCENPTGLLKRAYDFLDEQGTVGIIHWIYGDTPRGPSMDIRPRQNDIIEWATDVGFSLHKETDLLPYHYGILLRK